MTDIEKDPFPEEKILESIEQFRIDVRDFSKYLITLAVTIIPILIGIAGFLLTSYSLTGMPVGFLITGLGFIFITIPVNLALYIPTYKPYSRETLELAKELTDVKKEKTTFSIIMLVLGMLFAFIGILLIVVL